MFTYTYFSHFKIYSSETTGPNSIKPFSWDNPSVGLFQNCNRQPRSDTRSSILVHIGWMILGIFDKKYDDERQVKTILHVTFWVKPFS
jgi:hypothetical protein